MDTLGKLFGSKDIVRILRLFILNPGTHFELSDISTRTKVPRDITRQEITMLERIDFIRKRTFYKETEKKRGPRVMHSRKRVSGYALNELFPYLAPLRALVAGNGIVSERELSRKLSRAGRLKLVVLSGVFVGDFDSRLDLLVVGDRLRRDALERAIRDFEAEVGREIHYAHFSTNDFRYRLSMHDRLLRDTFDFTHSTVLDRLGIEEEPSAA